jgi:hypothetical protein
MYVVWNGVNHFDATEPTPAVRDPLQQPVQLSPPGPHDGKPKPLASPKPKSTPPKPTPPALRPAAARTVAVASHAAAQASRAAGDSVAAQREAALAACRRSAESFGCAGAVNPLPRRSLLWTKTGAQS